jgi:cysteinyl-tRNA synthetase
LDIERFWIQNVGDIDLKIISAAAENSNKFQKTRFWREKSVEGMVTLGPTTQATLVYR